MTDAPMAEILNRVIIGASQNEPHTNHSYKKIVVPMQGRRTGSKGGGGGGSDL